MRLAILITARMGSSRLAQKHLIPANNKPLLYWLIKRFEHEFEAEIKDKKVFLAIATSEKPENKNFIKVTEGTSCAVIQGSDNNIPQRHLHCANQLNATHILSVDGDDILCSAHAARVLFEQMQKDNEHDMFAVSGLPLGMNLSGYTVSYLEKSLAAQKNKKLETGWGRIFVNPKTFSVSLGNCDIMGDLRFTLDYDEDAQFFCEVINRLKEEVVSVSDDDLINFVNQHQLYKINSFLKEKYWNNYNSEKQKELNEGQ